MGGKENSKRVSAIVPAYNEGERIGRVLDVLTSYPYFGEVIVVDDGSTDNTREIVSNYNVKYIRNDKNMGKGYAMDKGVSVAQGDVIFFCDADINGLTHRIIDEIIQPVLSGATEMFIASRDRIAHHLPFGEKFNPIAGERALRKALWLRLPNFYKKNFRVETGLNLYAHYFGDGYEVKLFDNLVQTIKEKKYGIMGGFKQRWRMNVDLIVANWHIMLVDFFKIAKERRMNWSKLIALWFWLFIRNVAITIALLVSWPFITLATSWLYRKKQNRASLRVNP